MTRVFEMSTRKSIFCFLLVQKEIMEVKTGDTNNCVAVLSNGIDQISVQRV